MPHLCKIGRGHLRNSPEPRALKVVRCARVTFPVAGDLAFNRFGLV